jgi:SEC-C motif
MAWHQRKAERWEAEQRIGQQILDGCRSGVSEDALAILEGVFHVRSHHGHRYESVTIRVEYPASFPDRGTSPKVVLMSHRDRWQRTGDSHINSDWSLCLFVPGECGINFGQSTSLNDLFAVLHTFLFKEHLYQQALSKEALTGEKAVWPGEARSHGLAGIAEAIRDKGRVGRNEPCPCGSGKKFKVCCLRRFQR